ncbi:hypothetical protein ElyMa_003495400 [Elysia marginata]|uniref:Uncharacterized protein n=1 Tax=Elysia marginata TaxID=1093978 RepID=A0AAV4EFP5_9GAST|nr:hypothetical protein ElyMa_003495400 [Elysia marginata]
MASSNSHGAMMVRDAVKRKKENQGQHECEVLGEGPKILEGSQAMEKCQKNPGHPKFIRVCEFGLEDLPERVRSKPVFELVQKYIARTVQLEVCYVSMGRPHGYIFWKWKGKSPTHHGTGWLYSVAKGDGPCPCDKCSESSSLSESQFSWWSVDICTACHVIYDTDEAKCTKVNFFYDDENSKGITLQGAEVISRSPQSDWCKFRCAVHDEDLVKQLQGLLSVQQELWITKPPPSVLGKSCIVVSHPHGMPKCVTFGAVKHVKRIENSALSFTYTAATCSGSSGAPVLVIHDDIGPGLDWSTWCHWTAPHSGAREELNESAGAIELRT